MRRRTSPPRAASEPDALTADLPARFDAVLRQVENVAGELSDLTTELCVFVDRRKRLAEWAAEHADGDGGDRKDHRAD